MHYDITGKNNNARSEHELSLVSQLVYQTHCDNVCPYIYNGCYSIVFCFIDEGNLSNQRKPPTCTQVTVKLYHIKLYLVN
jgi:hypothetical protein